jgi:hypothetical protein
MDTPSAPSVDVESRLEAIEQKLDECIRVSRSTKRILLWILFGAIASVVLPLIGLLFVVPFFVANYLGPIADLL